MSSSLDILRPKPGPAGGRVWASETAKELERLARSLVQMASARDWSNPMFGIYMDADFHTDFDHANGFLLNSWSAYVEHHDRLVAEFPGYKFNILDSVADVYEESGNGIVYLLLRVEGHPANVVRESTLVMYWKRRNGQWCCHGQKVIRGMNWDASVYSSYSNLQPR